MKAFVAKPFIKWVGGKTQLLGEIEKSLPKKLRQYENVIYVEPFVGGGAVLFWMLQQYPNLQKAIINDINAELICTYRIVKTDVVELIAQLKKLQDEYISCDADGRKVYFLERRSEFNAKHLSDVRTAALFIFLNRTCFNGLYRVNSKGEFNVPHGKYANPKICDEENLLAVSKLLQKVDIYCGDFAETEKFAGENTIFYLDPPYKPISETSSFTSYAKEGFNDAEQIRLRDFCARITRKKAVFIASNSDPIEVKTGESFFEQIYYQFKIKRVSATRLINANPNNRGFVSEIMISNVVNA